jgi:pimeloyl-ACP methyl ester carboxylesterase
VVRNCWSQRPADRPPLYSIGDMAADVTGLIDGLGLGAVHLAGAPMGGFIAQAVALEHAARIRTLTLMTPHRIPPGGAAQTPGLRPAAAAARGGRPVAVKAIRAELAADPQFRTRFGREVAAARRVSGVFTA